MKSKNLALIVVAIIFLSGCAEAQHGLQPCLTGDQYGFFSGIIHGWIAPFSFLCSIFNNDVSVWAVNNTGGWYAFGFMLGIGALGGSASKASK